MKYLSNKVIDVWYGDIEPAEIDWVDRYQSLLDTDEQVKFDKLRIDRIRKQYLAVRGRVRVLLAEYTGARPEDIRFAQQVYGKPFLPDYPEISFNISHSGNKLVVAVGKASHMGVDIECWRDKVNFSALVKKCFADGESHYWHGQPEQEKIAVFYEYWTRKESFVKAVGRGIALGMEQCIVSHECPEQFDSIPNAYGPVADWKVITLELDRGMSGALSVRDRSGEISMNYF